MTENTAAPNLSFLGIDSGHVMGETFEMELTGDHLRDTFLGTVVTSDIDRYRIQVETALCDYDDHIKTSVRVEGFRDGDWLELYSDGDGFHYSSPDHVLSLVEGLADPADWDRFQQFPEVLLEIIRDKPSAWEVDTHSCASSYCDTYKTCEGYSGDDTEEAREQLAWGRYSDEPFTFQLYLKRSGSGTYSMEELGADHLRVAGLGKLIQSKDDDYRIEIQSRIVQDDHHRPVFVDRCSIYIRQGSDWEELAIGEDLESQLLAAAQKFASKYDWQDRALDLAKMLERARHTSEADHRNTCDPCSECGDD